MRRARRVIVAIIGVDGSGKTTLCRGMIDRLVQKGLKVRYEWLGAESIVMKPLRFFYRLFVLKTPKMVEGEKITTLTYKEILERKHSFFEKYRFLKPVYLFFVIFDYYLQFKIKDVRSMNSDYLVSDRYFYDVLVNLAITMGWKYEQFEKFLKKMYFLFPYPHIRVFVDIDPKVAFERKDDVISLDYLRIRRGFYKKMAKEFGFKSLDGENGKKELLDESLKIVNSYKGRVVYVHSNNRDVGGADFCLERMSNELRKRGFDTLVLLCRATSITKRYKMNGNPFLVGNFIRPQLKQSIFYYLFYLPWNMLISYIFFVTFFSLQQPDIVHVNDMYDFIPAFAAKTLRIPVVYHLRMIRSKQNTFDKLIGKFVYWFSDKIFAVSESTMNAYLALLSSRERSVAKKKLIIVRDWNDNERFCVDICVEEKNQLKKELRLSDEDFIIINVGRLEEWKGQHLIIEAVGRLLKENKIHTSVKVLIVGGEVQGKEDYVFRLTRLIRNYDLENVVKLLGEREDVHKLLKISNLFVHTSILPDPFPGTVVEAMLSGVPVLASPLGGVSEMIEDGKTGYFFNPFDIEDLKRKLSFLIERYTDIKEIVFEAQRRAQALTNKRFIVDEIEDCYLQILGGKKCKKKLR